MKGKLSFSAPWPLLVPASGDRIYHLLHTFCLKGNHDPCKNCSNICTTSNSKIRPVHISCWNICTTVPTTNCTVDLYSSIFLAGLEWSRFYVFVWARACTNMDCFICLVALLNTGLFTKFCSSWNLNRTFVCNDLWLIQSNIGIIAIQAHTLKIMQNANTNTKLPSDMEVCLHCLTLFTIQTALYCLNSSMYAY